MPDKPFIPILNLDTPKNDVLEHFKRQINMFEDLVAYGTNLIPRCLNSSDKRLVDFIILTSFLKQIVASVDAHTILIKEAALSASIVHLRTAIEAYFYLMWILDSNPEKKAQYYYVWDLRKELSWCKKVIPGTPEYEAFEKVNADKIDITGRSEEAQKRAREIQQYLESGKYSEINGEFDNAKGRRAYDVKWHAPLGVQSVRAVDKEINMLNLYEILYSTASESVHSSNRKDGFLVEGAGIVIEPIRGVQNIGMMINVMASIAFGAFKGVLGKYRPAELENYARKYMEDWREAMISIPEIDVKHNHNRLG